jgi:hypothetical protein
MLLLLHYAMPEATYRVLLRLSFQLLYQLHVRLLTVVLRPSMCVCEEEVRRNSFGGNQQLFPSEQFYPLRTES